MTPAKITCQNPKCKCVQFARAICVRCGRAITVPPVEIEVPVPCMKCVVSGSDVIPTLAEMEMVLMKAALKQCSGHYGRAAKLLGVGRTTLYRKLKGVQP